MTSEFVDDFEVDGDKGVSQYRSDEISHKPTSGPAGMMLRKNFWIARDSGVFSAALRSIFVIRALARHYYWQLIY
jgi:hypothetical protein